MLGAAVEALPVYGLTLSRSIRAIERRIVGMLRAVVGAWDQVGGSCPHFHLPPDLTLLPHNPPQCLDTHCAVTFYVLGLPSPKFTF